MLACRNEERVCRALWPNGFPDSLGGDCYHIEVHSSVSVHGGLKSEFVNYIRVCQIRLDMFRYFQICSDLFSSVMLCSDMFKYVQVMSYMFRYVWIVPVCKELV